MNYPLKSVAVLQPFGANVTYYKEHFNQNGHPGIDFQATHGTPVYAAHDGFAFYVGPDQYGGDGVWCRMTEPQPDGKYYTSIYWHLIAATDPQFGPTVGRQGRLVKQGDLIGYSDNTGAPMESTGDHLHFGLLWCDQYGTPLAPGNGFNSCVDPQPFFGGDTSFHHEFDTTVIYGQTSDEVMYMQKALQLDGEFPATTPLTGYYGDISSKAILDFRVKYGIDSSSDPTGHSCGPLTRAKLSELFK